MKRGGGVKGEGGREEEGGYEEGEEEEEEGGENAERRRREADLGGEVADVSNCTELCSWRAGLERGPALVALCEHGAEAGDRPEAAVVARAQDAGGGAHTRGLLGLACTLATLPPTAHLGGVGAGLRHGVEGRVTPGGGGGWENNAAGRDPGVQVELVGVGDDISLLGALPEVDTLVAEGRVVGTVPQAEVDLGAPGLGLLLLLLLLQLPLHTGHVPGPVAPARGRVEDERLGETLLEAALASPTVDVLVAVVREPELAGLAVAVGAVPVDTVH